jgi:rare lipoprotein A
MNKLRRILITAILLCATRVVVDPAPREPQVVFVKKLRASYYGGVFNGKLTANGTKFNANAMTAAHRKLPFGTVLKVVNPRTKQWVYVTVTDRGPFVKSRELDLSYAAARRLGILSAGVVTVAIYQRLP